MSSFEKSQAEKSKKGLGRGLGSLLGGVEIETKPQPPFEIERRATTPEPVAPLVQAKEKQNPAPTVPDEQRIWLVGVEKIKPNPTQPRKEFDPDRLKDLTNSVKEKGILQPIVVRRSAQGFEIIAGERRWRAAQAAGILEVPVIIKKVEDQESLELALIENIQRHDLNSIDEAEAYEILARRFGLTQDQIAQKVGKDRATVANSLRLLGLAPEVKSMLRSGAITGGHAKALVSVSDQKKQVELAKKIVNMSLSVRAAEGLVKNSQRAFPDQNDPSANVSQRLAKTLAEELQKILGTRVKIHYSDGEGDISIAFYSDSELTQIVERLRDSWKK